MNHNNPAIPVLHVEESTKRYYDVKSKSGRTHRKKYYDVDWRFYIMHKYGRYMVCGTRCPMREYYNEAWPVVSMSFNSVKDVFDYISILLGSNKINMTLFVSTLVAGSDNDIVFTQPTNERFRALDTERGDRRGELVGYDRISFDTSSYRRSKLEKILDIMSTLNSGGVMPFTVSPHPSKRIPVSVPVCSLPTFYQQYSTRTTGTGSADAGAGAGAGADDMPSLIPINADESEKYEDYGYIFGVNDYDHDAYAEVD
jgi:hypothetical protein